ncbi:GntR family transcriptional regulator [Streptomyces pseudovenezuelae]|uniref:DNA-binding FadR family transcriptional regulator n=1 Tax=Streptomyces pseudovenezuelae TaxID=67350 RepID=A0ABT6M2H7_9ACTN|nr:GntR family transcriptional regulator [Streptomyces pseudovenezuelae]MDH6222736.1 DNA-binding FadR family transcriptional regulator [Streptomyces pseudovenezuelae]
MVTITSLPVPPHEPATAVTRSSSSRPLNAKSLPKWQTPLQDLPAYTADQRLRHDERLLYGAAAAKARAAGGSTTAIAAFIGCSEGLVYRLLESVCAPDDSYDVRCTEKILRDRIRAGTYKSGHALPAMRDLVKELGVPLTAVMRALCRLEGIGVVLRFLARGYVVINRDAPPTGLSMEVRTQNGQTATWPLPGAISHIRSMVTARIEDGTYAEGSRLPTRRALGEEFGVTESLMQYVLKPLKDQGLLIWKSPVPGTFVHPSARSLLTDTGAGGAAHPHHGNQNLSTTSTKEESSADLDLR